MTRSFCNVIGRKSKSKIWKTSGNTFTVHHKYIMKATILNMKPLEVNVTVLNLKQYSGLFHQFLRHICNTLNSNTPGCVSQHIWPNPATCCSPKTGLNYYSPAYCLAILATSSFVKIYCLVAIQYLRELTVNTKIPKSTTSFRTLLIGDILIGNQLSDLN